MLESLMKREMTILQGMEYLEFELFNMIDP